MGLNEWVSNESRAVDGHSAHRSLELDDRIEGMPSSVIRVESSQEVGLDSFVTR